MTTLKAHERRITALEATVTSHGESIYELRRDSVANRMGIAMILQHLNLPAVTEEQIDNYLDQQ